MHFTRILVALSVLTAGGDALQPRRRAHATVPAALARNNGTAAATATQSRNYIIEADSAAGLTGLQAELATLGDTAVLKVFNSTVFTGLSVASTTRNADALQGLGSAARVWPSKKISLLSGGSRRARRQASPSLSASYAAAAASANYSVHAETGVDKLHAQGIFGSGAIVAVVDTGVQYTHPALGGCLGSGCKIAGGYDLVGDGCWPEVGCDKEPDDDPTDAIGHGTHVTGIIVGKNDSHGFIGVAPEAQILMYKVFADADDTDEDTLIEAFLMAYDAGADIITSSVGSIGGWTEDAWSVVAARLVDEGVVVTIAAGNDGLQGPFFANSGATGSKVLAVASVEPDVVSGPAFFATFHPPSGSDSTAASTAQIAYEFTQFNIPGAYSGQWVYPTSLNTSVVDDACDALPADTQDLKGTVTLTRLGGCDITTKQTNLEAYNGTIQLFYYDDTTASGDIPDFSIIGNFAGVIATAAGAAMVEAVAAGYNVTIDFSGTSTQSSSAWAAFPLPAVDVARPDYYTSWGPSFDLSVKPDVAAPGGEILSTYPTDAWEVLSGTSMSTPYIAGIAALYIGQYGGRRTNTAFSAADLAMRIVSSGASLGWSDGSTETSYGYDAPPTQVGTGLVNASKVLAYTSALSYAKFALNDTAHFAAAQSVDVTNGSPDVTVTYTFGLEPAAGFDDWLADDESGTAEYTPRPKGLLELGAPVSIVPGAEMPEAFSLAPGETKTVTFTFTAPKDAGTLPLYGGKIIINSTLGEELAVPYAGVGTSLESLLANQYPTGYPYIVSGTNDTEISTKSSFTFNLTTGVSDYPTLYYRSTWGTAECRWDVFSSDYTESQWTYPPVVGAAGFVGSVAYWEFSDQAIPYNPDLYAADENYTLAFPLQDQPRYSPGLDTGVFDWFGRFADGSDVVAGDYIFRVGTLVPFGDPMNASDWSVYSHAFTVVGNVTN